MNTRKEVLSRINSKTIEKKETTTRPIESFGINTFSEPIMKKMLSEKTFRAFKVWQNEGKAISPKEADEIARAMKEWAISNGVSSYTHWFQPMTGLTAEKHDSFISVNGINQILETFSGNQLIQGEPDASSFPSGGLRATFEARGYTAWDPSSPAFISEIDLDKTLCIPTIYVSYNGEALDKKLPLLRSDAAINKAAVEFLKLFGHKNASKVYSVCGAEQEYFLIDSEYYKLRSDILLTGRTLVGAASPKDQQLEDQYFGSMKDRMLHYMVEVAEQAYKLGIPLTTRHNEVAPHQYEFAPLYERSNIATDHNQLLMNIMKKVAKRHGLECLLHEKPFTGINGSGKHVNWSLMDNEGNNLLNPGDTPEDNLQFLTILVAVIHSVYEYADLLRASVATAGNEHRLGANEAPPAIISVFIGEKLESILTNLSQGKKKKTTTTDFIDFGLSHLPNLLKDNTDRNRTSPFAFTGNKFEFRAVGSSLNISTPLTVLNTIVADSLTTIVNQIKNEMKNNDFTSAVLSVISDVITTCEPVLFNGNNYSKEWEKEAKKRGLANEPSSAKALQSFKMDKNIALFEKYGVFNKAELVARYNIWLDIYNKLLDIEGKTLLELIQTQILPAAYDFQINVGNSLDVLREMADDETIPIPIHALDERKAMFAKLAADVYYIRKQVRDLASTLKYARKLEIEERSAYLYEELKPVLDKIRSYIDDLESIMPDSLWQLPKYREMLFIS